MISMLKAICLFNKRLDPSANYKIFSLTNRQMCSLHKIALVTILSKNSLISSISKFNIKDYALLKGSLRIIILNKFNLSMNSCTNVTVSRFILRAVNFSTWTLKTSLINKLSFRMRKLQDQMIIFNLLIFQYRTLCTQIS